MSEFNFTGWATRHNVRCSDGRVILKDAFKHNDGKRVPLVWNHQHDEVTNILGYAVLEHHDEGMKAYCAFNDTENGQYAKSLIEHGDITQLSIYANQLGQQKLSNVTNVLHGEIREVSLVFASANPNAYIESIIRHSADGEEFVNEDEGVIYSGEDIMLLHADKETETEKEEPTMAEETKKDEKSEKTVKDVYDEMTEEQKTVVHVLVAQAVEDAKGDNDDEDENEKIKHSEGGDNTMKTNVFDKDTQTTDNVLTHSDMEMIFKDAKRCGSLKEAFLSHADGDTEIADKTQNYGINGTDWLFPEARTLNNVPQFIQRDMGWVKKVMAGVHHTPFSRIKSVFADITEEDARAKGYFKGKLKKEEVFGLLKRTTTPTTIYKKQKLDRDDVNDIVDFDVVAWIKAEMRLMLDEEIARAILVGDGRSTSSDDKINELNIRPIWKDEDLYTIKASVDVASGADADVKAKAFIRAAIKSRKNYKGSGEPTLYTTEDMLTDCLLLEDNNGRVIYDTVEKLKNALRVKEIVTVPVMEGLTNDNDKPLMGIIVNLKDYNVGADKGGAVNMFDDFDIDYNAQKYLIETRCSGALIKPYSAIALELNEAAG